MSRVRRVLVACMPACLVAGLVAGLVASPAAALVDRDCGDFASQQEAQLFFLSQGGPDADPHRLDGSDSDGIACESLPGPYFYGSVTTGPAPSPTTDTTVTLRQRAQVLSVTDGDTIKVRLANGRQVTVRLIGIDTPEVYGGVECGGKQASASMRRLAPVGAQVVLVSDPTQDRVDRYGRILRYVMKAGRDLNRAQVASGWATVYVYGGTPFRRVAGYRTAESTASAVGRGIWSRCR